MIATVVFGLGPLTILLVGCIVSDYLAHRKRKKCESERENENDCRC